MGHTAPLTSKCCILYIYSINIGTEYFKHALYSQFFFSSKCSLFHNANLFGSCIIHILYTECAKIKKKYNSGAKELRNPCIERTLPEQRNIENGTFPIYLLLTYSMVQSPSWDANWFAASQEIHAFCGTRRFVTAFTSARQLSLAWASRSSLYPHIPLPEYRS